MNRDHVEMRCPGKSEGSEVTAECLLSLIPPPRPTQLPRLTAVPGPWGPWCPNEMDIGP